MSKAHEIGKAVFYFQVTLMFESMKLNVYNAQFFILPRPEKHSIVSMFVLGLI